MISIVFKSTMPAVITKFTTAALLLLALAACNSGGGGGGGGSPKKVTPTQVFKNLKAAGFNKGVDISWDAVKDATSYNVYYSKASFDKTSDSEGNETGIAATEKTVKASITGLSNNTTYHLRVETIIKDVSHLSGIISTKTNLRAPTNLKAVGAYKGVDLSWNMVRGATLYKVYYHTATFDSKTLSVAQEKTTDTTSIGITDLSGDTEYYLRVAAINAEEDTSLSAKEATATATDTPLAPSLVAKGVNKAIELTWGEVTSAIGYTIYYHTKDFDVTSDVSSDKVETINESTTTSTSIAVLTNGTTLYFRAIARYSEGVSSGLSAGVSATAMLPKTTITKVTARQDAIDLTWDAVTGATNYKVYYGTASLDEDDGTSDAEGTIPTNATKTSIPNLTPSTKYYIKVEANNGETGKWNTSLSDQAEATTILAAPTGLQATGGDTTVDINWGAVAGATSYKVYYHTANNFDSTTAGVKDKTTDTASISITDLSADTIYYFRVIAINASGSSALSEITSARTNASAITKPDVPTNLQAIGKDKAIDLSWDKVDGATSYTVYYRKDNSFDSTNLGDAQNKTTDTASISLTDLSADTEYFFRVIAINASGSSALSKITSARTKASTTPKPDAPTTVTATVVNEGIDLTWDAVDNATSYTVYYRKDNSFDSTNLGDAQNKTTDTASISLTDLSADTEYFFRVIAINASGSSALSQMVSARTKRAAPQPSAAASIISPAAVDLSWDAVAGVTGYNIYYATKSLATVGGYTNYRTAENGDITIDISASATGVTIGDLSADTTYYFVVTANYLGQKEGSAAPEVSADSSYIAELAMGGSSGCVRLNTGSIKCWGKNNKGQLGVGDTNIRNTATSVDLRAKQLSAGNEHSCAIDLKDKLHCWGANDSLQLGLNNDKLDRTSPQPTQASLTNVSRVTAGGKTTCAVAAGENYCWGEQWSGGLGSGAFSQDPTMDAQKINNIPPGVKQFAVGDYSGCAIDANDVLWCWGRNSKGQVGFDSGNTGAYLSPVKPTLLGSNDNLATMLDGEKEHYCAVDSDEKIQCWGWNTSGQLGIGSTTDSNSPKYVLDSTPDVHLSNVSKVATGNEHSCALIITGGKVRCWGKSADGRIGTDGGANRLVAGTIDIQGINNAIEINAGDAFTCVLLADKKTVQCWGNNNNGQLGRGTTGGSSHTPMKVKGL